MSITGLDKHNATVYNDATISVLLIYSCCVKTQTLTTQSKKNLFLRGRWPGTLYDLSKEGTSLDAACHASGDQSCPSHGELPWSYFTTCNIHQGETCHSIQSKCTVPEARLPGNQTEAKEAGGKFSRANSQSPPGQSTHSENLKLNHKLDIIFKQVWWLNLKTKHFVIPQTTCWRKHQCLML